MKHNYNYNYKYLQWSTYYFYKSFLTQNLLCSQM